MTYNHLLVDIQPPVATISINRPPMNVLHIPAIEELDAVLTTLKSRSDIFLLIFQGKGEKAFSAGVDIKDHTLDKVEGMLQAFHAIFRKLDMADWITVASVHGYCLGGGMELALFCDWVIAEESAVFGQPEIKVGCYPPVAAAFLPKIVGYKRAMEITMLGENMTARTLHDMGLVNRVVTPGTLRSETDAIVAKLSSLSLKVLQLTKKALLAGKNADSFANALNAAESIYLRQLTKTTDLSEGITAFMEKRKPRWTND